MIIHVPRFSGQDLRISWLKAEGAIVEEGGDICNIEFQGPGDMGDIEVTLPAVCAGVLRWKVSVGESVEFGQLLGSIENVQ